MVSVPLVEVSVDGDLDLAAVPQLRRVLDGALTLRPAHLVLNLASCPGIDAAGIGLLLDVHRELWRAGARLTLHAPTARLRRVLGIAHVDRVFDILPDAEAETPYRAAGTDSAVGAGGAPTEKAGPRAG
ncbi:STAS domain-containing protein, partial [Actinomycetes bacterium KLBMP 9797]